MPHSPPRLVTHHARNGVATSHLMPLSPSNSHPHPCQPRAPAPRGVVTVTLTPSPPQTSHASPKPARPCQPARPAPPRRVVSPPPMPRLHLPNQLLRSPTSLRTQTDPFAPLQNGPFSVPFASKRSSVPGLTDRPGPKNSGIAPSLLQSALHAQHTGTKSGPVRTACLRFGPWSDHEVPKWSIRKHRDCNRSGKISTETDRFA